MLNIYREPRTDTVTDYVIGLTPPRQCSVGGDWNACDPVFEPGSVSRGRGADLVMWMTDSTMPFTGEPGVATQRAGHVLEMVFSNVPFVETTLADYHEFGSDHYALLTVIPGRRNEALDKVRKVVKPANIWRFSGLVQCGMATLPDPNLATRKTQIRELVDKLEEVLKSAIEGVGTKAADRGQSAPWWADECKEAHGEYRDAERRRAQNDDEYIPEHRHYLSIVRNAKRLYWRAQIDNAKTDAELYRIIGWHKLGPRLKTPPFKIGEERVESDLGKAEALRKAVLERFGDEDDLDYDPLEGWTEEVASLPFEFSASMEEVEKHTIGDTSTSPGADGITVSLLKECWPCIEKYIHALFNVCLRLGYFPEQWRRAEVAMIPKVGKKDRTSPRSWRPIALLSCVGKGLERLVAKRMAWISQSKKVLSPQHGGALPKRCRRRWI